MKNLIERDQLESSFLSISSYEQILSKDYIDEKSLKLKRLTIFDKIRAKFGRKKTNDKNQQHESKKDKIVQYYYIIPEEIERRENELANLKWNDFIRKRELRKEIKALKSKKSEYYDSILKHYPYATDEEWQEFYSLHEQEMLEWINHKRNKFRLDMPTDEKATLLELYCEEYFYVISQFSSKVTILEQDIKGNVALLKTVFCKDYRNAGLLEILHNVRESMDGKLMPRGITNYRTYDLNGRNIFFAKSSKAGNIEFDMKQLEEEFEEMKQIGNKDEYINRAIDIFQQFVQIHPYEDGNGRTSRALLDIMLLNRDIVPPILYDSYYQRGELDRLSDEYLLNSNKKPLQDYIKMQIDNVQADSNYQKEKSKEMNRE